MTEKSAELKQALRREMFAQRRSLSPEAIRSDSGLLADCFCDWPVYQAAKTVMFYLAMPDEPQMDLLISAALAQGKRVVVPLLTGSYGHMDAAEIDGLDCLITGKLGLKMPDPAKAKVCPPADIDLVAVPGVAFDRSGNRLGMGAGYYDRFLIQTNNCVFAGIAWSFQIVESLSTEEHDIRMHYLMTEGGLMACGSQE
jgi:5-formyltetrahydrofolate cyclo-ligase